MTNEQASQVDKYPHIWIKDIQENDQVQGRYLVKLKKLGLTKNGDHFLNLMLGDRTGDIEARVWDNAEAFSPLFKEGDIIEIQGHCSSFRNRIQLTLSNITLLDRDIDPSLFLESTDKDIPEMMASLRKILRDIDEPYLTSLNDRFLSDHNFMARFKKAPAAKNFHHGYIGGLLEHTLSVCEMALIVADQYSTLDKNLLVSGGFLHDIGKTKEFIYNTHIDYSDEGRLIGHLVLGVSMLEEKIKTIHGFPRSLQLKLNHMILSHHGEFGFGSPKRPKLLEAFALHFIDDLDAKMNGIALFMDKDQQEGSWTDYNRMFERYLLKGSIDDNKNQPENQIYDDNRQKKLFST